MKLSSQQKWDNVEWTSLHFDVISPGTFFSSTGLGTMGFGFPVNPAEAEARRSCVDIAGDGSFNMSEKFWAVSTLETFRL